MTDQRPGADEHTHQNRVYDGGRFEVRSGTLSQADANRNSGGDPWLERGPPHQVREKHQHQNGGEGDQKPDERVTDESHETSLCVMLRPRHY